MSDYSDRIISLGPKSYWRFGGAGPLATDEMGYADCNFAGQPTWGVTGLITGDPDTAITCLAASTNHPYVALMPLADTGFTVEAWIKFTVFNGTEDAVFCKYNAGNTQGALLDVESDGKLRFQLDGASSIFNIATAAGVIVVGTAYHIVIVYSATLGGKIYVNAVEKATSSSTGSFSTAAGTFLFGHHPTDGNRFASFTLDEAAVYEFALTPGQVLSNYSGGGGGATEVGTPAQFVVVTKPASKGDTVYYDTTSTLVPRWRRLAVGATDTIYRVASALPSWSTLTSWFDAVLSSSQGVIPYRGASAWAALARPSAPSVLTHVGGAANPAWTLADASTYTPTLYSDVNVAASTAYQCQYIRFGATVTVSGKADVDPTLTTTSTRLGISLPVASNFGAAEDCGGVAFCPTVAGQGAAVYADTTNDRATMDWVSGDITNQPMYFTFTYQVI